MFDLEELFLQVNRLKQYPGFTQNNFLLMETLKDSAAQENSILLYNENAAALICNDNGVWRVYFYISSIDKAQSLKQLLQRCPHRPLVAECIGKKARVQLLSETLSQAGFTIYTRMSRWRTGEINFFAKDLFADKMFRRAGPNDVDNILRLLFATFDKYDAHLPSKKQLHNLAENGLVFCAEKDGQIVGTVCLERVGRNGIYLYLDAVSEECRSSGIGVLLLQFALYQFRESDSYTSWTDNKNTASNRMHQRLGFSRDGLEETVLLYK